MANMKYFSDFGGESVELVSAGFCANAKFAEMFPGVKGFRNDSFTMRVGKTADGRVLPITRQIEYKRNPSKHECNAKCMNGSHRGVCECRCGGKNHGVGSVPTGKVEGSKFVCNEVKA